jgi:hypothetical protein
MEQFKKVLEEIKEKIINDGETIIIDNDRVNLTIYELTYNDITFIYYPHNNQINMYYDLLTCVCVLSNLKSYTTEELLDVFINKYLSSNTTIDNEIYINLNESNTDIDLS